MDKKPENSTDAKPDEGHEKNSLTRFGALALVIAMGFLAVVFIWFMASHAEDFINPDAQPGQAAYKTEAEIQAELNRIVEEGMLNISIASVIEFPNSKAPGLAYIENVPSNHYIIMVNIILDETGETVYESGGMKPNTHIDEITLKKELAPGSHPATAMFVAYDQNTLQEVGQAAAKITLSVGE